MTLPQAALSVPDETAASIVSAPRIDRFHLEPRCRICRNDQVRTKVNDLLATIGTTLGLDITKQNQSNVGRPIRLVEPGAKPIKEVLA